MGPTIGLLVALLVASLVMVVAGLAMVRSAAPGMVPLAVTGAGGVLLLWHLRAVITGSGRRTAQINPWPWTGLLVVAGFGLTLGFALFDLLTGVVSPARVAMLVAGLVGLVAGLVVFIRDADLHERGQVVLVPPAAEPEPEPEHEVFFDPTGEPDVLHPRGVWPLPRRGSTADTSLWEEPGLADQQPAQRARRGA